MNEYQLVHVVLVTLMAAAFVVLAMSTDLLVAALLSSLVSLLAAACFLMFHAPDVALTEAAVGAGMYSAVFLMIIATAGDSISDKRSDRLLWAIILLTTLGGLCFYAFTQLPYLQSETLPLHSHIANYFQMHSLSETGSNNMVTAILASYRGYDTLGEVCVIFAAGIVVLLLFNQRTVQRIPRRHQALCSAQINTPILLQAGRFLVPLVLLYGIYILLFGSRMPGGGFQSGVILSAAFILYAMLYGTEQLQKLISIRSGEKMLASGVLIFASTGMISVLRGGNYLDYDMLANESLVGQGRGIFFIEVGVAVTIIGVAMTIFYVLHERLNDRKQTQGQAVPASDKRTEADRHD